jgi:hypothetical protein
MRLRMDVKAMGSLAGRVRWGPLVGIAVLVYAWFSTGLRPFTVPIDVAVGVPILIVLAVSWRWSRLGALTRPEPRPARSGLVVWAVLVGALAVWELAAYVASPRQAHPTLSSISDNVTSGHPTRALVFAVWVVLGWILFVPKPGKEAGRP